MKTDRFTPFSDRLATWLYADEPKTLNGLRTVFGEKSIAGAILLLMILPALPLPTGGITHIGEIVAAVLSLELAVGMHMIWLPRQLLRVRISRRFVARISPAILRLLRRYEAGAQQRGQKLLRMQFMRRAISVLLLAFIVVAFVAPPFSGLDTLPALGAVLLCLAMILEDARLLFSGILFGLLGMATVILLGSLVLTLAHRLF